MKPFMIFGLGLLVYGEVGVHARGEGVPSAKTGKKLKQRSSLTLTERAGTVLLEQFHALAEEGGSPKTIRENGNQFVLYHDTGFDLVERARVWCLPGSKSVPLLSWFGSEGVLTIVRPEGAARRDVGRLVLDSYEHALLVEGVGGVLQFVDYANPTHGSLRFKGPIKDQLSHWGVIDLHGDPVSIPKNGVANRRGYIWGDNIIGGHRLIPVDGETNQFRLQTRRRPDNQSEIIEGRPEELDKNHWRANVPSGGWTIISKKSLNSPPFDLTGTIRDIGPSWIVTALNGRYHVVMTKEHFGFSRGFLRRAGSDAGNAVIAEIGGGKFIAIPKDEPNRSGGELKAEPEPMADGEVYLYQYAVGPYFLALASDYTKKSPHLVARPKFLGNGFHGKLESGNSVLIAKDDTQTTSPEFLGKPQNYRWSWLLPLANDVGWSKFVSKENYRATSPILQIRSGRRTWMDDLMGTPHRRWLEVELKDGAIKWLDLVNLTVDEKPPAKLAVTESTR